MGALRKHVVVVGAGIVGAACAYHLARAGLRVTVLDRGPVAGGATGTGNGDVRVCGHRPGPELDLARASVRGWRELGTALGADTIELEAAGSLVVAATPRERDRLAATVAAYRDAGVAVTDLDAEALAAQEPQLAPGLAGGARFPADLRLQPTLATARLLTASGADVQCGTGVRSIETDAAGAVRGVRTDRGALITAAAVVSAAGVAAVDLAATVGTRLPLEPRPGFVLVTEPLGGRRCRAPIRHTVYAAGSGTGDGPGPRGAPGQDGGAEADGGPVPVNATVVAPTRAGTVLIGVGRDQVGVDPAYPLPVLRRLAAQAIALFPFLAGVRLLHAAQGYRPVTPDQRPVIGPDPGTPGLFHACGHGGAGVTLAPATGALITALVTGDTPEVDPAPYDPGRFT